MSVLTITEIDVRARRYPARATAADYREFHSKPRCYVHPSGETVLENLFVGRRNRPVDLYKNEVVPEVKQALADFVSEQLNRPVALSEFSLRWSQKAGCSCGCSPGFIVSGPCPNIDVFVTVEAANDAAAVVPEATDALEELRRQAAAAQQRTGRGDSGKLRNFRAMNEDKFIGVYRDVVREDNDAEAIQAVITEAAVRGLNGRAIMGTV